MFITIDNLVTVYNYDAFVKREALDATPERLFEAVRLAHWLMSDEFYIHNGTFPGEEITLEEFLSMKREYEVAQAARIAKREHTRVRRADFNAKRSQLALVMIEVGVAYRCAYAGCDAIDKLTVDHIVPLSRGGDDGLANLQFLCRSHNSAKGDNLGL